MSINTKLINAQVTKALNDYGVEFTVYRDIYKEDAIGCKELIEPKREIGKIYGLVDNSTSSSTSVDDRKGFLKDTVTSSFYVPYSKDILIQENDYIMVDNTFYQLGEFVDVAHYNLLFQISAKRIDFE